MLINIEMKGPDNLKIRAMYDITNACSIVKSAIENYKIGPRTIVSSFVPQIFNKMVEMSPERQFKIFALMNNDGPEINGYRPQTGINGMNLDLNYLQQSVITDIQSAGVEVGIWFMTST